MATIESEAPSKDPFFALDPDEALLLGEMGDARVEAEALRRDSLAQARVFRDGILACGAMIDSAEVERRTLGTFADSNPNQYTAQLRRERRLLGALYQGKFLHPIFQFDPDTQQPYSTLRAVLDLLPFTEEGWTALLWFYRPHGQLLGQRPADVFASDAAAVAIAAERDFVERV